VEPENLKNFIARPYGDAFFNKPGSVDHMNTPYDVLSVLHYGPGDFAKNDDPVLTYRHGLPGETWHRPNPEDPLSLIDQVELALAYDCADSLSKKNLVKYVHRNRKLNSMRIDTLENRMTETSARFDKLSQRGAYCGYQSGWSTGSSVITYNKLILSEGDAGTLDPATGVWTTNVPGLYEITWSLRNELTGDDDNWIYLYRNGQTIEESIHGSYIGQTTSSERVIAEQGGRTMLLHLAAGDTLTLRTGGFQGYAFNIHFCVMLQAAE